MNRGKGQATVRLGGYTIVEVMIFLAVSALMFVMANGLISGQTNKNEFVNAVRDLETYLNTTAANVANGYYPNATSVICERVDEAPSIAPGPGERGTNADCIFVGTVVKFGDGTNDERFQVFPMAGLRTVMPGVTPIDSKDLNDAAPVVVREMAQSKAFLYGASVACVAIGDSCNPVANDRAAIGFFSRLQDLSGVGAGDQGSTVTTDVLSFVGAEIDDNQDDSILRLSSAKADANLYIPGADMDYEDSAIATSLNPQDGITICLLSGGTNQYALIHVGGGAAGSKTIYSEIRPGNTCNN